MSDVAYRLKNVSMCAERTLVVCDACRVKSGGAIASAGEVIIREEPADVLRHGRVSGEHLLTAELYLLERDGSRTRFSVKSPILRMVCGCCGELLAWRIQP